MITVMWLSGCDGLFGDLENLDPPDVADAGDAGPADVGPTDDTGDTEPDADAGTDTEDVSDVTAPPEVRTVEIDEIGSDGVTLRGDIVDLGTPVATDHGFCVDSDPDFSPADGEGDCVDIGAVDGEGEFSAGFEDFIPGVSYYVRAWAENDTGTVYGDIVEFQLSVDELAGGNRFGCAIDTDGGLWCWGRNHRGQLGIGNDIFGTSTPQRVGDQRWQKISTSETYACAIDAEDSLWCWGDDKEGQLGIDDGFGDFYTDPQLVKLEEDQPSQWRDVATGDEHTCAIDGDGGLWCWGVATNFGAGNQSFAHPALGLGEEEDGGHYTPELVDSDKNWRAVTAGSEHTCAIDGNQQLWCWGRNSASQLGSESTNVMLSASFEPTPVDSAKDWDSVTAGDAHTCGLDDDDQIYCWGNNLKGQLGVGEGPSQESTPTEITEVTTASWSGVSTHTDHSCATTEDGELYCWGAGAYGRLGTDSESDRFSPSRITDDDGWHTVAAGSDHTCAVDSQGSWQCWGLRPLGASTPEPVALDEELDDITAGQSHSCAISQDSMWCWGHSDNIGMEEDSNDTAHLQSPEEIELAIAGGPAIAAGNEHTCFIGVDDDTYCWGRGQEGQLGNFDTSDSSQPVEVVDMGAIFGWTALSAGGRHNCGITTGSDLWCWGDNIHGQLGLGSDANKFNMPQQINYPENDWAHVASQHNQSCAIDDEQQLWCWGWAGPEAPDPSVDYPPERSPKLIEEPFAWHDVAVGKRHTCGIDHDQKLWCWGTDHYGQLGIDSNQQGEEPIEEPQQVSFTGSPDHWSQVFAGKHHTCAIDDDGDLWCWGKETSGQLGTGLAGESHLPTRVTAEPVRDAGDEWTTLSLGDDYTLALRDDGSAWSWGSNVFGQLGNDAAWRLVPGSIADF